MRRAARSRWRSTDSRVWTSAAWCDRYVTTLHRGTGDVILVIGVARTEVEQAWFGGDGHCMAGVVHFVAGMGQHVAVPKEWCSITQRRVQGLVWV